MAPRGGVPSSLQAIVSSERLKNLILVKRLRKEFSCKFDGSAYNIHTGQRLKNASKKTISFCVSMFVTVYVLCWTLCSFKGVNSRYTTNFLVFLRSHIIAEKHLHSQRVTLWSVRRVLCWGGPWNLITVNQVRIGEYHPTSEEPEKILSLSMVVVCLLYTSRCV